MSRKVSESVKKRVAGRQYYKCANKPDANLRGLEGFDCPLWKIDNFKGDFNESGYEIDHIIEHSVSKNDDAMNLQALCLMCHSLKTKRFMTQRAKDIRKKSKISSDEDYIPSKYVRRKLKISSDDDYIQQNIIDLTSEESSDDVTLENYINISTNRNLWALTLDFINSTKNNTRIISGYDKKTHQFNIYKFNIQTMLYEQIDSFELVKCIRNFKNIKSNEEVIIIASEVCYLTCILDLYDIIDSDGGNCYINGNKHGDKLVKRTQDDYCTKCQNDYYCEDIRDYVETFYEITENDDDKISKKYFIETYNMHNKNNITWNDLIKKNYGFIIGFEEKIISPLFFPLFVTRLKEKIKVIDVKYYEQFSKKHLFRSSNNKDKIDAENLINSFVKYCGRNKPTDREIIWYFSKNVFKLISRKGEEFPVYKWILKN